MKLPLIFQKVQLQPVQIDDEQDELMQAILNDQIERDNTWQLDDVIDADEALRMWHELQEDTKER